MNKLALTLVASVGLLAGVVHAQTSMSAPASAAASVKRGASAVAHGASSAATKTEDAAKHGAQKAKAAMTPASSPTSK